MVKRFLTAALAVALLPSLSYAQQATEGGGKSVEAFSVDDIKVILAPADNELVSIIVGMEGGLATGETDNPALGNFTADLITSSGSSEYSKDDLRRFLSRTSTRLGGGADHLGIRYSMTSTRSRFNEAWNVLSSLIREPLYDEVEYRNMMQRRVAQAQGSWSNPESYAFRMADSLVKINHPYIARYTYEEDLEGVTIPKIRDFQKKLSERSRLFVVVVGNVSKDEITKKLRDFSGWPKGNYNLPTIPDIKPQSTPSMSVVNMPDKPTTYIFAGFAGPSANDKEYWPLAVGLSYLRTVLFREIRTKRNLSYAPFAFQNNSYGKAMGVIGVSTVWPDSSMNIMLHEMQNMRDGNFESEELEKAKQVYITNYYFREMTNAGKANSIYFAERYNGGWKAAFSYDEIQHVDKSAVQQAFEKYARNLQVGIVGVEDKVTPARFRYANEMPN